jgi:hypothetical protein
MNEYINKHGQVIKLTEYQANKIEEILHLGNVELSSIPTSKVIAVAYDKRTLKDADAVKTALEGKGYSLDIQ